MLDRDVKLTINRSVTGDIVLADDSVSSLHPEFIVAPNTGCLSSSMPPIKILPELKKATLLSLFSFFPLKINHVTISVMVKFSSRVSHQSELLFNIRSRAWRKR